MRTVSKLQEALIARGISTAELARRVSLSPRSIHNLACGSSKSRSARQRIQQFLQTQVWGDVPFIASHLRLESGTILVFSNLEQAREFAAEMGESGERRDQFVRLSTELQMTPAEPGSKRLSETVWKAGDWIDIWCGEAPPDSPFSPNEPETSGATSGKAKASKNRGTRR